MLPVSQIKILYAELGLRIRKLRLEKGHKQGDFAKLLNISRASLVNIEQGRQHPPLHNLYEIARLLEVKLQDLLPELTGQTPNEINKKIEQQIIISSKGNVEVQEKLLEFIQTQKPTNKK